MFGYTDRLADRTVHREQGGGGQTDGHIDRNADRVIRTYIEAIAYT